MSEKKMKLARNQEIETKQVTLRINVELWYDKETRDERTTYMVVTGVPKDLPDNMMDSVRQHAESQFAAVIQERRFIEMYSKGKSMLEEQPTFINLDKVEAIKIQSVTIKQ